MRNLFKRMAALFFTTTLVTANLPTLALAAVFKDARHLETQSVARTRDEAMAWVRAQVGKGLDFDGAYGNQCVDFICYYYQALGVPNVWGNAQDYTYAAQPAGMTAIAGATPQTGDVLVWSSSNGIGHVAIYDSNNVMYHQNYAGKMYVTREVFPYNNSAYLNYGGVTYSYWGVVRPDFKSSDSTPPTISDVRVSNVDATGYTVTCTVTDNTGVSRVQFPTWTLNTNSEGLDQDDLQGDWGTSEKYRGTQDGTTWAYRVNISDHGYEQGLYRTHVYAYDLAGNMVGAMAPDTECVYKHGKDANVANGTYKLLSAADKRYALDVYAGGADSGVNVDVYEDNGSPAQQWRFERGDAARRRPLGTGWRVHLLCSRQRREGDRVAQHRWQDVLLLEPSGHGG